MDEGPADRCPLSRRTCLSVMRANGFENRPIVVSPIRSPIWRRDTPSGVVGCRHRSLSKRFSSCPAVPSDSGFRISRPSDSSALALLQVHLRFLPDRRPG
jgi:hypothetical protein